MQGGQDRQDRKDRKKYRKQHLRWTQGDQEVLIFCLNLYVGHQQHRTAMVVYQILMLEPSIVGVCELSFSCELQLGSIFRKHGLFMMIGLFWRFYSAEQRDKCRKHVTKEQVKTQTFLLLLGLTYK